MNYSLAGSPVAHWLRVVFGVAPCQVVVRGRARGKKERSSETRYAHRDRIVRFRVVECFGKCAVFCGIIMSSKARDVEKRLPSELSNREHKFPCSRRKKY